MEGIEKRVTLSVRIPEETARRFKAKCAMVGTTGQFILSKAIEKFLEEKKDNPE